MKLKNLYKNLPKFTCTTLIILTVVIFQYEPFRTIKEEVASLVGGLVIKPNSKKTGITKKLPVTSMQTVDPVTVVAAAEPVISVPSVSSPYSFLNLPVAEPLPMADVVDASMVDFLTPEFQSFVDTVKDGQTDIVRGVYVPGVIANEVIQQPSENWSFVSEDPDVLTEFHSARRNGVTGLLAHNYLLGNEFYDIQIGQYVGVVYGDGTFQRYVVSDISQFEKLDRSSLTSDMVDLETGVTLTSTQIFNRFYSGGDKVTFQTCLERNGKSNWGLTFVTAVPVD
ncbi:MAG: hypothetical protein EHM41_16665 [Chloroflexi bacterium]|nr:MAG: hypothetical protein EHM41_16665 [Chloroflexota bacterium]